MPEKTTLSRTEKAYTLADAHRNNQLIRVRCYFCNITRNYLPNDLIQLVGVMPVHTLTSRLRCDECKRRDYLKATAESYSGADYGTLPMRRLKRIDFIRQVTWDDGVL